jgi:hypothetical protein
LRPFSNWLSGRRTPLTNMNFTVFWEGSIFSREKVWGKQNIRQEWGCHSPSNESMRSEVGSRSGELEDNARTFSHPYSFGRVPFVVPISDENLRDVHFWGWN